jgi:hypothetical protein
MQGLDVYKTVDGFTIARLHYSADPDKITSDGEPTSELLEGYVGGKSGAAWRKEMEIDFTAYSGQLLCYGLLNNYSSKIIRGYEVKPYHYKVGSVDWGRNNPCSFHEYIIGDEKHIHSNHEIHQNNMSVPEFCNKIKVSPHYNEFLWISADPSLWNKNQETREGLRSLEDMFREEGVILRKGISRDDSVAIEELLTRWSNLDIQEPRFTISHSCPKQRWEFERLRYRELTTSMIEKSNPHEQLVDKDNHSWDDFKYMITTFLSEPNAGKQPVAPRHSVAWFNEQAQVSANDWKSKYR